MTRQPSQHPGHLSTVGKNRTSLRRLKVNRPAGLSWLVAGQCGDPAEVAVFEGVGVAFEGDDVGVVDDSERQAQGLKARRRVENQRLPVDTRGR